MPQSGRAPPHDSVSPTSGYGYSTGDLLAEKYRLVRVLGEGGMGLVWVAKNEVLDVHVALKLLSGKRVSNRSKVAQRMRQEARTAAQLGHPAICRALDFGETHRGDPFLVTELMHGESLADRLEAKIRLPATETVRYLLPIIEGLSSAHGRGIVHRDVKPDNIFLARDHDGRLQPKLLDFGVARFIESDTKLTVDGALLGTPGYMSPEQARGKGGVDARSDVWSLCVVVYEAITGEVPFTGGNYNEVLWTVVNEEPASILSHGAGDETLWRVVRRGLEKDPQRRWQSIWELGEALALWAYERDVRDDVCGTSLRTTWLESSNGSHEAQLPESVAPLATPRTQADTIESDPPAPVEPPDKTLEGKSVTERVLPPSRRRAAFALLGGTLVVCGIGIGLGLSTSSQPAGVAMPSPVRAPGSRGAGGPSAQQAPAPAPSATAVPSAAENAPPTARPRRPAASGPSRPKPSPKSIRPASRETPTRKTPVDDHELGF